MSKFLHVKFKVFKSRFKIKCLNFRVFNLKFKIQGLDLRFRILAFYHPDLSLGFEIMFKELETIQKKVGLHKINVFTSNYQQKKLISLTFVLNSFFEIILKSLIVFKLPCYYSHGICPFFLAKKIMDIRCKGKLTCHGCHALIVHCHYLPLSGQF